MEAVEAHDNGIAITAGGDQRLGSYLTVRETAEVLHMHFMSVYKMVQSGRLPAVKVGSRWKIDPVELRGWITRHHAGRRRWLVVGSSAGDLNMLDALLGPQHAVVAASYGELRASLTVQPDAVVLDATHDSNAALAALAVCRQSLPGALAVLWVAEPSPAMLRGALTDGVVTLLPQPATAPHLEQLVNLLATS